MTLSAVAQSVLAFTGERFAPEVRGAIWYEHWHRYCLAAPLVRGLTVLDAACGEGYGSALLAQTAREVYAVDIAGDAIGHARARYPARNLHFREGSCTALPLPDTSVDRVVSFETIEHLAEQAQMLAEFRRVLVPDGVLILSSPNQPVYSGGAEASNEYHVRELTRFELAELLRPVFPQQAWYGQRVVAHSALWAESPASREGALLGLVGDEVRTLAEPAPPMYFVVVCAAEGVTLPALPSISLFDDGEQSLYRDYHRALLREKALYWGELDARKVGEERLAELIVAVNGLAREREKTSDLGGRLIALERARAAAEADCVACRGQLETLGAECVATKAELAAANGAFAAAAGELAAARGGLETARRESARILDERNAAGAQAARVAAELALIRNDLAAAHAERAALRAQLTGAGIDLAAVRAELGATRGELATAQAVLETARGDLLRQHAAMAEVEARLGFRETTIGWLRWPLARLRTYFGVTP